MSYATIRDIIGHFQGKRLEFISQHDEDEYRETGKAYVELMFEGGYTLTFYIGEDGFDHYDPNEDQDCRTQTS